MTPEEYGQRIKALEEEVALLKEHISQDQGDLEKVSDTKDGLVLQNDELVARAKRHREERDHYKERWLDNLAKLTHAERLYSDLLKWVQSQATSHHDIAVKYAHTDEDRLTTHNAMAHAYTAMAKEMEERQQQGNRKHEPPHPPRAEGDLASPGNAAGDAASVSAPARLVHCGSVYCLSGDSCLCECADCLRLRS